MNMKLLINRNLIIFTFLHFLVDFICVGTLFLFANILNDEPIINVGVIFLLYNCFAFLLQPIFGYLVDLLVTKYHKTILKPLLLFAVAGLIFGQLIIVFLFNRLIIVFYIGAFLLAVNNALFHVVGGKEILSSSYKATPGGIFVCSGAIGVGLGTIIINNLPLQLFLFITPFIMVILSIIFASNKKETEQIVYPQYKSEKSSLSVLVVLFICFAVLVRSFLGFYSTMSSVINTWATIFLLSVAVCVGKAIGGIILDLAGPYFLIVVSTAISIISSLFIHVSYFDYIYLIAFNLLMPLTLDALRYLFPNKEGFAFGLAAGFLIPGYLLGTILKPYGLQNIIIPIICLLTGILLFLSYYLKRKNNHV